MKRRTFLVSAAGAAGVLWMPRAQAQETSAFRLSDVGSSRATGYAEANKIVTLDGKTHVAWLDSPEEGFRVRIRTLDHASGTWSDTVTVGDGFDNHGGPALTVDSDGYLHIAYYPHHHPMRYRKSIRPNDATEWGEEEQVGQRTTYPTLVCAQDNTLILTCRESDPKGKWVANRYIKRPGGAWEGPLTIMQALVPGYAHFMEALAWSPDYKTLHLACRLYDGSPGHGHTIGYMRSDDLGETWARSNGDAIALPVTAETIEAVAKEPDPAKGSLRAGAMAISPDGKPYILCSSYGSRTAWVAWLDKDHWARTDFALPDADPERWGLVTPGGISFTGDGTLHVVLSAIQTADTGVESLWGHPGSEIAVFESSDRGQSFTGRIITDIDPEVPRWLPNMERPTGHNAVPPAPGVIYTEGGRGGKNTELVSNKVYFLTA